MISCTEFIPAYSALFTYLEENFGPQEVPAYWTMNFDPTKAPLYRFVKEQGIRGCFSYWTGTLNEEAADFTLYLDEEKGYFLLAMHHCPSKGRLLTLQEETGVPPYHSYCLHCDHYRESVEANGLEYIFNCVDADKAACSILVYDPKIFAGQVVVDEKTVVMDRRASDNEYFHKAFHGSLNKGVDYLLEKYSEDHVRKYLQKFASTVYGNLSRRAAEEGLGAIEEKILDTYAKEHASDAVHTSLSENLLTVTVDYCPAEKFLRSVGVKVSPAYSLTTSVVMETVARNAGFHFSMDAYDPETGAAKYHFWK